MEITREWDWDGFNSYNPSAKDLTNAVFAAGTAAYWRNAPERRAPREGSAAHRQAAAMLLMALKVSGWDDETDDSIINRFWDKAQTMLSDCERCLLRSRDVREMSEARRGRTGAPSAILKAFPGLF